MRNRLFGVLGAAAMAIVQLAGIKASGSPKPEGRIEVRTETGPQIRVYAAKSGLELRAYIFRPAEGPKDGSRSAIIIFHGGGWAGGAPQNTFDRGRHFASLGMVAISAEYRLSDQKTVTPLDAMEDARDIIRWARANAALLGIRPNRIAVYGSSAGAHLAASAAIFNETDSGAGVSSVPDAMILVSPAVEVMNDGWLARLLGGRAEIASISPAEHVRKGLPPTLILQGDLDTVTPLRRVSVFCDRMRAAGNSCDLVVYPDVGHVFTPKGIPDDGNPRPDPKVWADALKKGDEFLKDLGFLD
jgi:acetyl esterase